MRTHSENVGDGVVFGGEERAAALFARVLGELTALYSNGLRKSRLDFPDPPVQVEKRYELSNKLHRHEKV